MLFCLHLSLPERIFNWQYVKLLFCLWGTGWVICLSQSSSMLIWFFSPVLLRRWVGRHLGGWLAAGQRQPTVSEGGGKTLQTLLQIFPVGFQVTSVFYSLTKTWEIPLFPTHALGYKPRRITYWLMTVGPGFTPPGKASVSEPGFLTGCLCTSSRRQGLSVR